MDEACSPVFILSCVRSGSTLLRYVLDTHQNICSPGHLNLGVLSHNLYHAAYMSIGSLSLVKSEKQREGVAIDEVRRVVYGLMNEYAQGKGKKRWCEKSTDNIDYLDVMERVFWDGRYICLYRNCLDVVYSCVNASPLGFMSELAPYVRNKPENFVAAVIEYWLEKVEKLLAFEEAHPDRVVRVRYEDLVTASSCTLEELFAYLGESWDHRLLDSIFSASHDPGPGDHKVMFASAIKRDSIGKGINIPFTAIPEGLVARIDAVHKELGYQLLEEFYFDVVNDVSNNDFDIEQFFTRAFSRIAENKTRLDGVCKIMVTGQKGGVWTIEAEDGRFRFVSAEVENHCIVSTSYHVFCELASKRTSILDAHAAGKITGEGNVGLAFEFGRLIFCD